MLLRTNGIQVDEHAVAQQVVDLVLADAVAPGQPQQRCLLVGRVVVDVHVRDSACGACGPSPGSRPAPDARWPGRAPTAAGTRRRASSTPHRYSRPHSRPSAVHSGSPSKSKNRSPLSGSGSSISGCASTISYGGLPSTRGGDLQARLCGQRRDGPRGQFGQRRRRGPRAPVMVVMPASISRARWLTRMPATSSRSSCSRTWIVHSGQRKHARTSSSSQRHRRCRRPGDRRAGAAAQRGGAGTPGAARRPGSSRWRRRRAPARPREPPARPRAASVSA